MTATLELVHRPQPGHARYRRRRAGLAGTAALAVLLGGALAGCGARHDKNGDTQRPDVQQLPVIQTVLPSAAVNPPITVTPYPSSSASLERGDNVGTH